MVKSRGFINTILAVSLITILVFTMAGCGSRTVTQQPAQQQKQATDSAKKPEAAKSELPKNAKIIIKLGHPDSEIDIIKTPYMAFTEVFKSEVEGASGGRIGVQIFPNSQLGDLKSMMEQTARGDIQMVAGLNTGLLSAYYSDIQVIDLPYIFQTTEVARNVLNGKYGQELAAEVAQKSGIKIVSFIPTAFRNFSNNVREIKTPDDMKGLKIRTMQIPIHMAMVKALGANPTAIPFEELYQALQTGVADGQENAPYTMMMVKAQEVQKYYTLDKHTINLSVIAMNEKFYNSLTPEDQRMINQAVREATFAMLGIISAKGSGDLKELAKAGMKIYTPTPEEFKMFKDRVQGPVLKEIEGKIVSKQAVDKLINAVKDAEREAGLTN